MRKRRICNKRLWAVLMSVAVVSASNPAGVLAEDLLSSGPEDGYETEYVSPETNAYAEDDLAGILETETNAAYEDAADDSIPEASQDSASVFEEETSDEDANDLLINADNGEDSTDASLLMEDAANTGENATATGQEAEGELLLEDGEDTLEDAEAEMVGDASGTCGADLTWTLVDGVLTITGTGSMTSHPWSSYKTSIKKVIIGGKTTNIYYDAFYGYSNLESVTIGSYVANIGNEAFYKCTSLKSITLPNSVETIGNYAFYGCTALSSVKMSDSVTSIGYDAFKNCTSLKSITLPSSLTSIGTYVFQGSGLESITLPGSLTTISEYAFADCTSLKSVYISDNITRINWYAFSNCTSLESVRIPNSVTELRYRSFQECTSLKTIQLPTNLTYLGDYLFSGCTSLESVGLPANLTEIHQYAFNGCTSLASFNIPDTVTSLGQRCFYGCTSLKKIRIPAGISTIPAYAFAQCTGLTTVSIPSNVTRINEYAFSACTALTDVYYDGSQVGWNSITFYSDNICLTTANIHYNATMPLDKPVLASPTLTATGVKLTWGAVSGAEKYRVFYRVSGSSSWTKAADTTSTSYQVKGLTSGKTYQFTVRCVNSAGTSFASDSAAAKSIQYIATPVISSLTLGTTGVNVKWSAVSGAAKYRVFYKQSGATSWTKAGDTTSTAYTVDSLNSGKTYYFTVRCVNAAGTAFTSGLNSTGNSIRFVKAPVLSSVQNTATGTTLKWQASSGATKYRVFYKVSGESSWTKAGDTTATSYTVNGLVSGKTYIFTARCLNTTGTSFTSNFYSAGKSIVFLSRPSVSAAQATRGVKVTWSKVTGATGYAVYRKVSGGSWIKIKTISSGSTVSYTDTTGTSGTRYYYTVRATKGSSLSAYVTAGASAIAK